MIDKAQPGGEDAGDPTEDAAWDALRAELGDEGEADDGGSEAREAAEADEGAGDEEREAEGKEQPEAKLSYEELEKRYRQSGGALKEERLARKAAQEEARKAREQAEAITKMIAEFRAGRQPDQQQEQTAQQAPSREEDPIGFFDHQIAELRAALGERDKRIEQLEGGYKKTDEQLQADQRARALHAFTQQAEVAFRKQNPDYDDACEYLVRNRSAELAAWYPDDSARAQAIAEQQGFEDAAAFRQAILQQESVQIAQHAAQMGASPAQLYYEAAKARGYQPRGKAQDGKGAADVAIEAARRGAKASRSLSGGEGRTDNPPTMEDLAELYTTDPEAADKLFDKMAKLGQLG